MSFSYKGKEIEVYTQPIQWLDYKRYTEDLDLNHRLNLEMGFTGSLCYLNHNDYYDPWLLASQLVSKTGLKPLVAVNPAYHHPYIIARSIFTLSAMRQGPIALNFIAGTATGDLQQIGQLQAKEQRYRRLGEMIQVIRNYLEKESAWTFDGDYFKIEASSFLGDIKYQPEYFVAGHSSHAEGLVKRFSANWAKSLLADDLKDASVPVASAMGFGVYLAETAEQGKKELSELLGIDQTSKTLFRLRMANTDAQWKQEQAQSMGNETVSECYFPEAIQSPANVPFLVGNLEDVARLIKTHLLDKGIRKFIVPMVNEKSYQDFADVIVQ